jgi:TonB family protein
MNARLEVIPTLFHLSFVSGGHFMYALLMLLVFAVPQDSTVRAVQDLPAPSAPVLISKTQPEYTPEARKAKVQGMVLLKVTIEVTGRVRDDVQVLHGLGYGLDEKAIAALKEWRWKPGTDRYEKPKAVLASVEVAFRL